MDNFSLTIISGEVTEFICRLFLLVSMLFASTNSIAGQESPVIISSGNSQHQKSLLQNILSNLEIAGVDAETDNIDQSLNSDSHNSLIVSIGNSATSLLKQNNSSAAQLRVLTQINVKEDLKHIGTTYLSMTQPVCQQFALIRLLNSEWKSVSVLLSGTNTALVQTLKPCAKKYELTLNVINIEKYVNLIDALNTSLLNSDTLLALPDPEVYNTRTIKSILLTTYRHRIPVIGFSKSFVHAGALAAIHTSTQQLGKEISEIILKLHNKEKINKHYLYPEHFDITINKDVAKSLGIITPDRKVLIEKLKQIYHE